MLDKKIDLVTSDMRLSEVDRWLSDREGVKVYQLTEGCICPVCGLMTMCGVTLDPASIMGIKFMILRGKSFTTEPFRLN